MSNPGNESLIENLNESITKRKTQIWGRVVNTIIYGGISAPAFLYSVGAEQNRNLGLAVGTITGMAAIKNLVQVVHEVGVVRALQDTLPPEEPVDHTNADVVVARILMEDQLQAPQLNPEN